MRPISGASQKFVANQALAQLDRRIDGIQKCVDRMLALPLAMRTNWWQGQLRYFHRELAKLRAARAQMLSGS